jgi:hypothetical protein
MPAFYTGVPAFGITLAAKQRGQWVKACPDGCPRPEATRPLRTQATMVWSASGLIVTVICLRVSSPRRK